MYRLAGQQGWQLSFGSGQTSIQDVKTGFCSCKRCFFSNGLLVLFFTFFLDEWIVSIYADTCYLKLHPDVLLLIFKCILKWGESNSISGSNDAFFSMSSRSLIFRPTLFRLIDGRLPSFSDVKHTSGKLQRLGICVFLADLTRKAAFGRACRISSLHVFINVSGDGCLSLSAPTPAKWQLPGTVTSGVPEETDCLHVGSISRNLADCGELNSCNEGWRALRAFYILDLKS